MQLQNEEMLRVIAEIRDWVACMEGGKGELAISKSCFIASDTPIRSRAS